MVCSHNPAAGRCVLGGPVHANVYASLSSFAVVDAARDTYKESKLLFRLPVGCLVGF